MKHMNISAPIKKITIIVLFFTTTCFSQDYPKDYFRSPLDIPLDLSGSFGELRSNHFHSGLDIKTNAVEGLPVYAAADGYISRIKISTWGYGKAIYISHPNGFTSVYAHLQNTNSTIETVLKNKHYSEKSFEIELFFKPSELPVRKGDIIAYSGNSGGSGGPHLHFEIRNTKTEQTINPLLFGFDKLISDKFKPKVNSVMIYPNDEASAINDSFEPQNIPLTLNSEGNLVSNKVKINGTVGFGVNTFDNMTNSWNKNGIYKVSTFVNGVPYFSYKFDSFSFDESKNINYFIDFYRLKKMGQRFQKMFIKNDYNLSIVDSNPKNGLLKVQSSTSYTYKIIVEDFFKNATIVEIPVVFDEKTIQNLPNNSNAGKQIKAKNEYNFEEDICSVYFPSNTFYEDFKMKMSVKDGVLYLHEDEVPVKNSFTLTFDIAALDQETKNKSFIAYVDGKDVTYNTSYVKGSKISAKVKKLGTYKVVQDLVAPKIYGVSFEKGKNIDKSKTISIKISDNLSGIDSYNAYLNGKWILMEYDYKTNELVHNLSDNIYVKGLNEFKLIVKDKMNNTTVFDSNFIKNN